MVLATTSRAKEKGQKINAFDRGLQVLEILAQSETKLGVTEIGNRLDADKSTAYRLLATLQGRGYIEQDPETKKYGLGLKLAELGGIVLGRLEIRTVAKPYLKELASLTGEAAHLAALVQDEVVYLDKEDGSGPIRVNTEIGRRAPIHCTAIGKALIASLPETELEKLLAKAIMSRFTVRTITSLPALRAHLQSVAEQGYAVDDEEFELGVRCIAAPIRNHAGKVAASVGISGSSLRITLDKIEEFGKNVIVIANKISLRMGY